MSLTKASYSMINGAPVNVVDYGASTSETGVNNSAAFNAAKAVAGTYTIAGQTIYRQVYVPPGTYAIDGTVVGNFFTDGVVGITGGTVQYVIQQGVGASQTNTVFGPGALPGATPTGGNAGLYNSAFGQEALTYLTTGYRNTGVGYGALRSTVTNYSNTGVGYVAGYSLSDAAATGNTALGARSLYASVTGYFNTAVGSDSLQATLGGYQNTGCGKNTLYSNLTGNNNAAFGMNALYTATDADNNTAVGAYAQFSAGSGYTNTSSGYQSLYTNINGNDNAAFGALSLYKATGSNNSALGRGAGYNVTTGAGNLILGAQNSSGSYLPVFDVTTENDRVVLGTSTTTNAYIQVAWTVVSDLRDKVVLGDVPHGLDFVCKLKPIKYQFKESRGSDVAHGPIRYGLGAQDVLVEEGSDPVIVDVENPEKLKITDSHLIPVLVNAIRELKAEFEAYKANHP